MHFSANGNGDHYRHNNDYAAPESPNLSIISLQMGNFANFTASHFWNSLFFDLSDSQDNQHNRRDAPATFNHNIFFVESESKRTITYYPRMIAWDWKCNLQQNECDYASNCQKQVEVAAASLQETTANLWPHSIARTIQDGDSASPGDNDDDTTSVVTNWRREFAAQILDRSIHRLCNTGFGVEEFNSYPQGAAWLSGDAGSAAGGGGSGGVGGTASLRDTLEDQLHWQAEMCDSLQGFQLLYDANDGFSGLAGAAMEHVRDEFGTGKCVLAVSVCPHKQPQKQHRLDVSQRVNRGFALPLLNQNASSWTALTGECVRLGVALSTNSQSLRASPASSSHQEQQQQKLPMPVLIGQFSDQLLDRPSRRRMLALNLNSSLTATPTNSSINEEFFCAAPHAASQAIVCKRTSQSSWPIRREEKEAVGSAAQDKAGAVAVPEYAVTNCRRTHTTATGVRLAGDSPDFWAETRLSAGGFVSRGELYQASVVQPLQQAIRRRDVVFAAFRDCEPETLREALEMNLQMLDDFTGDEAQH